jgi:hypothetical protein
LAGLSFSSPRQSYLLESSRSVPMVHLLSVKGMRTLDMCWHSNFSEKRKASEDNSPFIYGY